MADDDTKKGGGPEQPDEWEGWTLPGLSRGGSDEVEDLPPCPNCGSEGVVVIKNSLLLMGGLVVLGISVFLLIIPPLALAGFTVGIILCLVGWSNLAQDPNEPKILRCRQCETSWKFDPTGGQTKPKATPFPRPVKREDGESQEPTTDGPGEDK